MEIKNRQLVNLSNILFSFADKKVPFSLAISRNTKIVNLLIEDYNSRRIDIINEHAILKEDGTYLGLIKPDAENEERYENPQNLMEMEIENRTELFEKLKELDNVSQEVNLIKIDMSKVYYDSVLKEKSTVEDYINTNVESNLITLLSEFNLIDL